MTSQHKRYQEVAKQYIATEAEKAEVIGIVICGSLAYSKLDKNSDIDIHVILDESCNYRERGNTWMNDIEVEYFKNPARQIRAYFQAETASPHTAHMLAHGNLAYSNSQIVNELVVEAQAIITAKPPAYSELQLELERYFIDDYYKDLDDVLSSDNALAEYLINAKIINRSIDIFCKVHRIRRYKDKSIDSQLSSIDPKFVVLVQNALITKDDGSIAVNELRAYIEHLIGGGRTKEWHLRSDLTL